MNGRAGVTERLRGRGRCLVVVDEGRQSGVVGRRLGGMTQKPRTDHRRPLATALAESPLGRRLCVCLSLVTQVMVTLRLVRMYW